MILFFCILALFFFLIFFALLLFKTVLLFPTSEDLLLLGCGFSKGEEAVFPHPAGDPELLLTAGALRSWGAKKL